MHYDFGLTSPWSGLKTGFFEPNTSGQCDSPAEPPPGYTGHSSGLIGEMCPVDPQLEGLVRTAAVRNGGDELLPPHFQRCPVAPTHPRCACRRNWSTTSSTSSTTTQGPSYKRLVSRAWLGRTRSHFCKFLKITRPKLPSWTLPTSHRSADTSRHFTSHLPATRPTHPPPWIALSDLNRTLSPFVPVTCATSASKPYGDASQGFLALR
jgi:hypothetical protein